MGKRYRSKVTPNEHDLIPPENVRKAKPGQHPQKPQNVWPKSMRELWRPNGYMPVRIRFAKPKQ